MSRTRLRISWNCKGLSLQEMRDRFCAYAEGVRHLHPLTSNFSTKGVGGSYKKMLTYPNVWDMTDADWKKEFKRAEYDDSYMFSFWNRLTEDGGSFLQNAWFRKTGNTSRDLLYASTIPDPLLTEDLLLRWLKVAIEAFDADTGEIATFETLPPRPAPDSDTPQSELISPLWRAWLKPGEPWSSVGFLRPADQPQPYTDAQPWLNGTLYTWPEFEPWELLHRPSIMAQTLSGDPDVVVG